MAQALMAAGVAADRAYCWPARSRSTSRQRGERTVDVDRLLAVACETLGVDEGERAIGRLRRPRRPARARRAADRADRGTTGTGKSTVATAVAHRLGITRVTSTDFIRQTMRAFFSDEFMPTIHFSSFEAGEALDGEATGDPLLTGFVDQCRHVCVGVDAAIRRSLTEGWSMVLEGVHLVPGMVPA